MPEPVARIRKLKSNAEVTIDIVRAPQNVAPGKIPPVMRVHAKRTITYKDLGPGGGLWVGDQVLSGTGTSVEIEFLIGGAVYMGPDSAMQIAGERQAIPIGETAARQTRQVLKEVAWELAPFLLAGGAVAGAAYAYAGSGFAAGVAFDAVAYPVLALRTLGGGNKHSGGGGIGPAAGIRG